MSKRGEQKQMPSCRRENKSSLCHTEQVHFASGAFRNVMKGVYEGGARDGEVCVSKEFKTGSVFEDSWFDSDTKVVERAVTIIDR
jgi:hypothetical protein